MAVKVGVVSTTGCPHCKRAKAALKDAGVEYQEADLATARDVLAKVKETTGQGTVPQVFIGGDFIGGATDVIALLEDSAAFQARLDKAAERAFPEGIASLLAAQVKEDTGPSPEEVRLRTVAADLETGVKWETQDVKGKERKVATGAAVAAALTSAGVSDVVATATGLLKLRLLAPVDAATQSFEATSTALFTLSKFARAEPIAKGAGLNEHIPCFGEARSAIAVSADLRARILDLYDRHLSADGRAVDYEALANDAAFGDYVDTTAELQRVDLMSLSRDERIAFFINVYNALIVHATVAIGAPDGLIKRLQFFGKVHYVIGGHNFSADDMEHGVLRNNAVSPASIGSLVNIGFLKKAQFPGDDPRKSLSVAPVDPRIHFALVCGAKSCPPIKLYSPENLQEGLQEAATAFCEGEIEVDTATNTVIMSKILKWYGGDFGATETARLEKFAEFLSEEKKAKLLEVAGSGKAKLHYKPYDWATNSKH